MTAPRALAAVILVCLACSAVDGQTLAGGSGGHFRYATMFWRSVETDPPSNTVEITIESAWRRSYSSNYFTAAKTPTGETLMQINGKESPVLELGDGMMNYLESVKITAWSEAEDWFLGEQVFRHTYNTPNNAGAPWLVKFKGCCRMSTLRNNADSSWEMHMSIDRTATEMSPRIVSLPVIYAQKPSPNLPAEVYFNLRTAQMSNNVVFSNAVPGVNAPASHNTLPSDVSIGAGGNVTVMSSQTGAITVLAYAYDSTSPSIKVPVDFIVYITPSDDSDPQFSADSLQLFAGRQTLHPGFERSIDISGYMGNNANMSRFVGFTVGPLPPGAKLSTVRGKGTTPTDPAIMTFRWSPCTSQMGTSVVCFDVVNSVGIAATQKCLILDVVPDPAPEIYGQMGGRMLEESITLYIGATYTITFTATDSNPSDIVMIAPSKENGESCVPPDCTPFLPGVTMSTPVVMSAGAQAMISLNFTVPVHHNHGGYKKKHCMKAFDSCGGGCGEADQCPGVEQSVVACLTVNVARCQFIVRPGQDLQEIAAMYHTDWLQLWSHNQQLMSPDTHLMPGSIISIGHLYAVQPFEKAADVAKRFGMTPEMFTMLNTDMDADMQNVELCTTVRECSGKQWCVLPSSCVGESSSIYTGAYAERAAMTPAAPVAMPMPGGSA